MIEDMNNQHASKTIVPGAIYAKVAEKAANAIWKENPDHLVIADGNEVGTKVIPEITHLPIAQSCRGYYPGIISHYKAPWAMKDIDNLPPLKYPGQVGDQYLSRKMLEDFYEPWIKLWPNQVRESIAVNAALTLKPRMMSFLPGLGMWWISWAPTASVLPSGISGALLAFWIRDERMWTMKTGMAINWTVNCLI